MAAFNSFGSIVPDPSVSNRLKASRISSISSSEVLASRWAWLHGVWGAARDCLKRGMGKLGGGGGGVGNVSCHSLHKGYD